MLVETGGDGLVEGRMGMARNDMRPVGFQNFVKPPVVGHRRSGAVVAELLAVLLLAGRRDMQADDHRRTGLHAGKVLFEPAHLPLFEIADVKIVAPDEEVVVEHHIMDASDVERIVDRTVHLLELREGGFVRASVDLHVMVAHRVAERDSRTLHHFVVPAVKRMVVRHDVAAADAVERHAAVTADRGGDVVGRRREFRKLLRRPYLRIGDGDEPVTRIVARTAEQRKIAGFAVGRQRVKIAHHALFHRSVVARRYANEDEAVVGAGLQSVISSFVGARELFAVGDPDAFHAPAAAKDAPLDRDAARGPCAGAPQRQQNCQ